MGLTKPRAAQIFDIDYKQSVRIVTVSNITLSAGAPSQVDGVTLSLNDRVLVTGQSTGSQNGLYYVTTVGSGSNGTWARTSDGNETGEIEAGMIVMVTAGTIYADTQWKLTTDDPIVIGTTALTFVQNYSANSISAGTSNVVVNSNANVTVSSAGTANVLIVTSTGANVTGTLTTTGNITGGNLITAGQISATGTITTAAGTNSTGFAVGNGAVSNVGLGFFPTAGTRGDYAIRDYSNVTSTMYFDVGMGGSAAGEFQFRTSNAFTLLMRANSTGVYSPGVVSATGIVSGLEITSTQSSGDEGGQLNLAKPATNSTLGGNIIVDIYQNRFRIFENGGTNRGAFIDLTSCNASVGTNLLSGGGGGGTPGGANTNVQFNDAGTFGGNASFTYDKVLNTLTAGTIAGTLNGVGQNFKVGDDAWIGDINVADTIGLKGQQNAANCYIVFGNSDATGKLGRSGTGPLTYAGAFTATGNISGGNLSGTSISGTLTTAAQTNITSVGTLSSLAVTANITSGNVSGTRSVFTNLVGTLETAAQTNITSVGTLSSLTVTANVAGGNLTTAGQVVATGNVTGGNLIVTGNIVDTAALEIITSLNGNITLSPNGTGVIVASKDIRNGQANGVGNIGTTGGFFNTIFAKATSAQYADLAEMYVADAEYAPGTVVEFGGTHEITISSVSHSTAVAGIISTNPSYLMNSTQSGEHVLPVALTGRVPCRVQGPVRKGDVLVSSSTPGVAQRIGMNWQPGCVVGKSMENITEIIIKTIEVAVGRL